MSNNKTVKWKRFSRASYAVFNSLHKEIAIGVLAAGMFHSAGLKAMTVSKQTANGAGVVLAPEGDNDLFADSLGIALGDVNVLGTRVPLTEREAARMVTVLTAADVTAAAVHSINDLLEYAVGVDVRQRGEMGVQTDISVRGGTFDQITILLNGINISSPHTGHLSADFPVSMDDIERIEVVEGPAARVFGTSAFTGVINIVTKTPSPLPTSPGGGVNTNVSGAVHLHGGAYGYAGGDARVSLTNKVGNGTLGNTLSGGYSRADGATDNSYYSNTHFFYQGQYASQNVRLNAQVGYSYKPYGANTFYGASSTDQWESNERLMAALKAEVLIGKVHILPQVYWNRWYDHYQWHRGVSPSGENYHKVDVLGGGVNAWLQTALGKTSFGVDIQHDGIWSTALGKAVSESEQKSIGGHDATSERKYTKNDDRTNISAFLEHDILLRDWTVSLGILANHNTGLDSKWRFYPGIDIAYRLPSLGGAGGGLKLFASWNMALRMPTYTELYYSGKNIEGTSDLKPEKTNDVSVGAKYRPVGFDVQAQLFYSHKTDLIDWVVYADETSGVDRADWIYRSGNFSLNNIGVELQAAWLPREQMGEQFPLRRLAVNYAYINEDIKYARAIALSKYAQEYLRHKVVIQADGRLWRNLTLSLSWRWQEREGANNSPYSLLDGRLSWDARTWSLYADCTNILDKTYYDYSIVRQPGRWLKGGFVFRF